MPAGKAFSRRYAQKTELLRHRLQLGAFQQIHSITPLLFKNKAFFQAFDNQSAVLCALPMFDAAALDAMACSASPSQR